MNSEIQALAELIEGAQALLAKHGEKHWASWLEQDARRIQNLDLYGVEHVLSAFGGMGSINDLVLHPINGHLIQENEIDAANAELANLLNRANALAKKLYSKEVSGESRRP
ncbi:MAG: hypothetical protein JNN20_06930 [Betaproteobacteria bacterium]|nr:hypothetical protein [Betaproteobacteria bacterium]